MTAAPLRLMLVDDEPLARSRLRQLLGDIVAELPTEVVAEAGDGVEALEKAEGLVLDAVLLDIRMPRMDGMQLALHLARRPQAPALIFVTAYDSYAVKAFELCALDYLLKPVRAQRLREALVRVGRGAPGAEALRQLAPEGRHQLRSTLRGRVHLIPVEEVLYLKAEQKYVAARTAAGEYLLEESLTQLETELGERFIRVHRNCLVARAAIAGYEHGAEAEPDGEAEGEPRWQLILRGIDDRVAVSRRQWPQLRALLKG
ncbi:LytR/AlgR family response regulator transcription factor [Denitratisoma oestradiolicum]|uniref:Positive alginate biosynthesis regulatory protein n=1 Tax=Denitratisoma oestradiolicum TaxID=311182 RepID=A0A6S6XW46_9PROT|nr:LytTR family DNA-binding domain-containing protein [Denitratisoma oestradiolicum]TWO80408.1 DNA-binding response regulator [Denitratisoma oestradiolicum]CAB1370219.1 Positive alginate biosynthesis regulatory protein [Denitratisoma oestradiolicum]